MPIEVAKKHGSNRYEQNHEKISFTWAQEGSSVCRYLAIRGFGRIVPLSSYRIGPTRGGGKRMNGAGLLSRERCSGTACAPREEWVQSKEEY